MNPAKLSRNLKIVKLRQAGVSFEQIAQMTRDNNIKPLSRQAIQQIYNRTVKLVSRPT
jgi:transcriptional regulator